MSATIGTCKKIEWPWERSTSNSILLEDPTFKSLFTINILTFFVMTCVLILYVLGSLIYKRIQHDRKLASAAQGKGIGPRLSPETLPGPPQFPIRLVGSAFQLPSPKNLMQTLFEWCKKYGPCFRLTAFGLECVIISSPSMAQSLLSSYDMGHVNRASSYKFLEGFEGLAFSRKRWKRLKRIAAPAFHFKSIEQQITKFNKHSDLFVEKLKELFKDGKPHSIHKLLGIYAIQSVVDSVVSLPNCSTDADADQFVDNFKIYTEITSHRLLHPWLALGFIWRFHHLSPELSAAVRGMNNFAKVIIQKHMDQVKKIDQKKENEIVEENSCLITQMLKANSSFEEIQTEVTTMLFAHESNTLSLLYFLLMLALNPEHQEKCRAEVDELLIETQAKDGASSFDFNSVSRLKHLERCFLETLRILPPVFMYGRKLESPLCLENNVLLPPGMNVYVCPLVMHKDENYFPNPDAFNPDRFLPEECKKRHPYAFLPFSAGPRICLGMKSATFSIKILVAKILRNFEVVTEGKLENLKFRFSLTMGPEKEPSFVFIPRKMN